MRLATCYHREIVRLGELPRDVARPYLLLDEHYVNLHYAQPRFRPVLKIPTDIKFDYDSMESIVWGGRFAYHDLNRTIANLQRYGVQNLVEEDLAFKADSLGFMSPLTNIGSLRDFYAFEQHVKTASQNRGRDVPSEWYEFPVFYYNNPHTIYGHEDTIPHPSYSNALDYELEIACVIGTAGIDIKAEDAEQHIFGYMTFNDWSARDVQRKEMKVGLGPAKGKDFAKSFGPYLVTADELQDRHTGRPGVYSLEMVARVNGVEKSRGNMKDLYWSFGQMIERASQDVWLQPGDVIGSGTVGTGCLLELTKGEGPWLQPGDVVELEIERLGVLRNTVGEKRSAISRQPSAKTL